LKTEKSPRREAVRPGLTVPWGDSLAVVRQSPEQQFQSRLDEERNDGAQTETDELKGAPTSELSSGEEKNRRCVLRGWKKLKK